MPRLCYIPKTFTRDHAAIIAQANEIIADYRRQGFNLTLRQLYYQFVARDLLENTTKGYKRLGGIVAGACGSGSKQTRGL